MKRTARWILLIAALAVSAGSLGATQLPAGIEILGPDHILLDRTQRGLDGELYLEDLEGVLRRFVTTTTDPLVINRGSGEFHPLAREVVEEALLAIDPRFLAGLRFEVFLLPYPVANPLTSWAGPGAIYLSPGVYSLTPQQIHQLVGHEIGHLVHRANLSDDDTDGWQTYRTLRGIQDTTIYHAYANHANRPHEVFAEDFRVLFAGKLAGDGGGIENADLSEPDLVFGLRSFFLKLIGEEPAGFATHLTGVYPNPIRAGQPIRLFLDGVEEVHQIELFDVSGRLVHRIDRVNRLDSGLFETSWNGTDDSGQSLSTGLYFGRIETESGTSRFKLHILP